MKFLVIETFQEGKKKQVYDRFHEMGRMLPHGLTYVESWVERDGNRCFQLMETEDDSLFDAWIAKWTDLADFEIVPVTSSPTKQSTD